MKLVTIENIGQEYEVLGMVKGTWYTARTSAATSWPA